MRQAPLIVLFVLLTTCRLDLQITKPEAEVDARVAYGDANSITIEFKFSADEPSLRCRYTVEAAESIVLEGVTDSFPPGTWQKLTISLDVADGEYTARLFAQTERDGSFVDLPFLTKTVDFFLDTTEPAQPALDRLDITLYGFHLFLSHPELSGTDGTPVAVRYTLGDGSSPPTLTSTLYEPSAGIVVPLDQWELKLRAVAFDEALNPSAELVLDPLYTDTLNPAMPDFSVAGGLFNTSQEVSLSHAEWAAPLGSLVRIYYTMNGDPPSASSTLYVAETKIPITMSSSPVTLKAIAIDDAGRESGVNTAIFNFVDIQYTKSTYSALDNTFDTGPILDQYIYLYGYGFLTSWKVVFLDANFTPATANIIPTGSTPTFLKISVVLPDTQPYFTDNGTYNEGILRLMEGETFIDEIAVDLVP